MKRIILLLAAYCLLLTAAHAQYNPIKGSVDIYGTNGSLLVRDATTGTKAASALVDCQSTTKGFLAPRMTQAQRNLISSPATGLMIYQTDGTTGFYVYSGTAWMAVGGAGSVTGTATEIPYFSPSGLLVSDAGFTKDSTTGTVAAGAFTSTLNSYALMNDTLDVIPFVGGYAPIGSGFFINGIMDLSAGGYPLGTGWIGGFIGTNSVAAMGDSTTVLIDVVVGDTTQHLQFFGNGNAVNQLFSLEASLPGLGNTGYEVQVNGGITQAIMYATNFDGSTNLSSIAVDTNSVSINADIFKITDGTQGLGKVLTSDAAGVATWESLGTGDFSAIPNYINNAAAVAAIGAGKLYWTDDAGEHRISISYTP